MAADKSWPVTVNFGGVVVRGEIHPGGDAKLPPGTILWRPPEAVGSGGMAWASNLVDQMEKSLPSDRAINEPASDRQLPLPAPEPRKKRS